ncbi:MAG: peptidase M61 [Alphaproteobacteria bacterium]|nr:peptidase M61 [Alphaproteobacteria bacterium]
MKLALALSAALFLVTPAFGQTNSEPKPAPAAPAVPAPRDVRYPGVLSLTVDATDLDRKIFWVKESVPVAKPGELILLYPQWIPGNHSASGPMMDYTGIRFTGNGKPLKWVRDPANVYAFRVTVPSGVKQVDVSAQFVTAVEPNQGSTMITPEMLRLNWWIVSLYPAGHFSRQVMIDASVKLPEDWKFGTALETASADGDVVHFKTVGFDTLVDSPLIAGKYLRKYDLDPGGRSRVTFDVMGDTAEMVDAKPEQIETIRNLIKQADKLYGARHYNHYDMLLSVSSKLGGMGLEHQRSSDNGVGSGYFKDWDQHSVSRDLLAHEYTHSWNGKYRRPADLWTPSFNVPMRDSLLWVYEGMTQYWGQVLAVRAGFYTKAEALDVWAMTAATYDYQKGREWRPLTDTTNDPIIASRRPIPWRNWQRSEDYYSEGQLIWLEIDTLIRQKSDGKKSLDDFARAFLGMNDGDWGQLTYTWKDVVDTLNKVQPYDWDTFLRERILDVVPKAPLAGFERGGYKLVYSETPSDYWKAAEKRSKGANLTYSIGLAANKDGDLTSVTWDSPAFKAGLTVAAKILAVNGEAFDADTIRNAVAATKSGKGLELLIKTGETYKTVKIDYAGGTRYPKLERIDGAPTLLDDIFAAK